SRPVIGALTVVLPAPVTVSPHAFSSTETPFTVRVPALDPIAASRLRTIGDDTVLLPPRLASAPMPPAPAPARVSGSLAGSVRPPAAGSASVPPDCTVVPTVPAPSAPALPTTKVPAFTVVVPL